MQRSKQQALMFLLGAVLVGGVLGFSADRVMGKKEGRSLAQRTSFYEEFHISADQRKKMDSIFDDTNCKTEELIKPIRPQLDSVKLHGRRDWLAVMTPTQRAALSARETRVKARRDSIEKARAAEGERDRDRGPNERSRRCGARSGIGGPGSGAARGPGGPFFR